MPFSEGMAAEGRRILRDGRAKFENVVDLLPLFGPTDDLHRKLRHSLRVLRSAMNWLEDNPRFELAHRILDDAGRFARENFPIGCQFPYQSGSYYQTCPVALAHNRVGLSPAFTIGESECSICGNDPEDCAHISGLEYHGKRCYRIIKKVDEILEISLVSRPNMPDARIESISLDHKEFARRLGKKFTPGMTIMCDRCLNKCDGVVQDFKGGH